MLRFLRRLFGSDVAAVGDLRRDKGELVMRRSSRSRERTASEAYFESMSRMQEAISRRDYQAAARLVHENLRYIPKERLINHRFRPRTDC